MHQIRDTPRAQPAILADFPISALQHSVTTACWDNSIRFSEKHRAETVPLGFFRITLGVPSASPALLDYTIRLLPQVVVTIAQLGSFLAYQIPQVVQIAPAVFTIKILDNLLVLSALEADFQRQSWLSFVLPALLEDSLLLMDLRDAQSVPKVSLQIFQDKVSASLVLLDRTTVHCVNRRVCYAKRASILLQLELLFVNLVCHLNILH